MISLFTPKKVLLYFTKANASGYPLQGRREWHGQDISVENRKGSYRVDKHHNPPEWKTKMHCDYGYIKKTEGTDGDHLDVFVGPDASRNSFMSSTRLIPKVESLMNKNAC